MRSSPQAGRSAALRLDGDRAAFRGWRHASGRRASRQNCDTLPGVEHGAGLEAPQSWV